MFGGLPLYVDGIWRIAAQAVIGLSCAAIAARIARCRPWQHVRAIGCCSPRPCTPPACCYLVRFRQHAHRITLPVVRVAVRALLIAAAFPRPGIPSCGFCSPSSSPASPDCCCRRARCSPPAPPRSKPRRLGGDTIVLVPNGNDGVGIVGAFGIEAPPLLPILVIRSTDPINERIAPYSRVALAVLAQDHESIAAIAAAHAILDQPRTGASSRTGPSSRSINGRMIDVLRRLYPGPRARCPAGRSGCAMAAPARRCCCCTAIRRRTRCGIWSHRRWRNASPSSVRTCAATGFRSSRRPHRITRPMPRSRWQRT